jgi:hypothetical protein
MCPRSQPGNKFAETQVYLNPLPHAEESKETRQQAPRVGPEQKALQDLRKES